LEAAASSAVVSVEGSSAQNSSQRNAFSEYRNVLKSHSAYSEDFVTNSSIGDLSKSQAQTATYANNGFNKLVVPGKTTPMPRNKEQSLADLNNFNSIASQ